MKHHIPFTINTPNARTHAALQEAAHSRNLEKTSLEQLKKDWDNAYKK